MSEIAGLFYDDGKGNTCLLHGRETPEGGERAGSKELWQEYFALPREKQLIDPDWLRRYLATRVLNGPPVYYAVQMFERTATDPETP